MTLNLLKNVMKELTILDIDTNPKDAFITVISEWNGMFMVMLSNLFIYLLNRSFLSPKMAISAT